MRIGILGGSFNPVHCGHLRLAVEAFELLALDRMDLVPCGQPPHKPGTGLLPFPLRLELAALAVQGREGFTANGLEGERTGPSYTYDTLAHYRRAEPGAELFFLLGAPDFLTLGSWHKGHELVRMANFVAAPRAGDDLDEVDAFVRSAWPGQAEHIEPPLPAATRAWRFQALPGEAPTLLLHLPLPALDVSASAIRQYWRQGRRLDCLLPEPVAQKLFKEKEQVNAAWG